MSQDLHNLFKSIKTIESGEGLERKILRRIALERNRQVRRKLMFSFFGFLGSAVAAIYMGITFGSTLLQSEFWSLAKLMFTDAGIVTNHWMDFSFSLLETFPAAHAAVFLVPVFLLLLSANFYFKSAKNNHTKAWA